MVVDKFIWKTITDGRERELHKQLNNTTWRYEDAFIAVNAYIAANNEFYEEDHPRDDEGKFTETRD